MKKKKKENKIKLKLLGVNNYKKKLEKMDFSAILSPEIKKNMKMEEIDEKKSLILRFIENGRKEDLKHFIKTKLTNEDIFELSMGHSKDTIIHKLIILDYQSLFIEILSCLKQKLTEDELDKIINFKNENGDTPLLYAVQKGNFKIVKKLISEGAKIRIRNNKGLSVMHMAAMGNKPSLLIYFKDKYKMDILDNDNGGNTPLHWACTTNSEDSINFLLSWINDINVKNKKGENILFFCIYLIHVNLIRKLINEGIDLDIDNNSTIQSINNVIDVIQSKSEYNPQFKNLLNEINSKFSFSNLFFHDNKKKSIIEKKFTLINSFLFIILHLFFELSILITIIPHLNYKIFYFIFAIILFLLMLSFILIKKSDPGYIKSDDRKWLEYVELEIYINDYCPYCKIKKTIRVKHCYICNKCVEGFEHHCIWIDNCIGDNNSKLFSFFLLVILFNLIFSFYISFKCYFEGNSQLIQYYDNIPIWLQSMDLSIYISVFIMIICLLSFILLFYVSFDHFKKRFIDCERAVS